MRPVAPEGSREGNGMTRGDSRCLGDSIYELEAACLSFGSCGIFPTNASGAPTSGAAGSALSASLADEPEHLVEGDFMEGRLSRLRGRVAPGRCRPGAPTLSACICLWVGSLRHA